MAEEPNHKHFTRGGQIAFHNLRMFFQINKALFNVHCICWLVFFILTAYYLLPIEVLQQTSAYYTAQVFKMMHKEHIFILTYDGESFRQSVHAITTNAHYPKITALCLKKLIFCIQVSMGMALCFALLLSVYFVKKGKFQAQNQYLRGSKLLPSNILKREIKARRKHSDITIDGFPLIDGAEVQHLLVHGTVGTGKSQLIMKILDVLRQRGDRVIVYDKGCSFVSQYFNEQQDVILNPFDARCPNWDMWLEAPRDSDFENMAESLIPMHGESDPFWVNAARTVFASCASKLRHDPDRSIEKLLKLLVTGEFSHLEEYLQGTPAATLVSGKIEKTTISIRSVITTYLKSLVTLSGLKHTTAFSIRDYILDDTRKGWLFISSNGEQQKVLKPLMSMWLAMASLTLLSLTPDRNRRIWFVCDELPSLHKLPLLGETIAEVRKFGGCFLLGMQSFAQLTKVYGQGGGAKEIFDLLNTRFFFRSPSSDMARLVSGELGEEEIEESRENYSYGANSIRDGISLGSHRVTRPVVSYPEVLELEDMNCFLRLPGRYPVTQLTLKLEKRVPRHPGFIERTSSFDETLQGLLNSPEPKGDVMIHKKIPMEVEFDI